MTLLNPPSTTEEPAGCWCRKCNTAEFQMTHFIVCPKCGNKRCPHASDHDYGCTDSNDHGQPGSVYGGVPLPTDPDLLQFAAIPGWHNYLSKKASQVPLMPLDALVKDVWHEALASRSHVHLDQAAVGQRAMLVLNNDGIEVPIAVRADGKFEMVGATLLSTTTIDNAADADTDNETDTDNVLLPCPFCGAPADDFNPDGDMEGYHIGCSGKHQLFHGDATCCPMHTFSYTQLDDAVAAWNHRVPLTAKAAAHPGPNEVSHLRSRLLAAQVASCSCMTKTPAIAHHAPDCRYRLFAEARRTIGEILEAAAQVNDRLADKLDAGGDRAAGEILRDAARLIRDLDAATGSENEDPAT